MDINQAKIETKILIDSGQAVMWSSSSGIGKSQTAVAMAKEWVKEGEAVGEKRGWGIMFLATQTPPDLVGYQFKGERDVIVDLDADGKPVTKRITVTDASCPLWFTSTEGKPAFCYDKFWLIIDEYGQGEPDVKRAAAEVLLNGGTPPWYLPPGSIRMALTNEGSRYGVSKDFDFAIARRTKINITGSIEALLLYMDKKYVHNGKEYEVMGVTKAWAAANPHIPFEDEPAVQGPWCNPRQLIAADRYLQTKFAATGKEEVDEYSMDVLAGTIGQAAATSYAAHLAFKLQLPSYADVVADPTGTEVPAKADLQMLMAYELSGYVKVADLQPVITYIQRLPKDMSVTFISSLLRRDYKGMVNAPAMQAWINKNAALITIISSLSH